MTTGLHRIVFKTTAMITLMVSSTSALSDTTDLRALRNSLPPEKIVPLSSLLSREERDGELSVRTRKSPSYNPHNIRVGEFILEPSIETFGSYTDNVYLTDNNKESDFIYGVRPELKLRSDFIRHQLKAEFYYEDGNYRKISEEDYDDYGATVEGLYDVYQGLSIPLSFGYKQSHSRRDDPEDRRSIDPTVFNVTSGSTGFILNGHSLNASFRTGFQNFKYDDTTSLLGGRIDNSDRDRIIWSHYASVGFPTEAVVAPFAYAAFRTISYDQSVDNLGIARDSDEIETGVGTKVSFSDVTKATFRVGHVNREFDDSSLDSISDYTYGIDLNWEPSTLMAFSLAGQRQIKETSTTASAKIETSLRLSMLYELAPNILLEPQVAYIDTEYTQSGDYKTQAYEAGVDATYKLNPNLWATLEYEYKNEDETGSSSSFGGFKNNIVALSLKFQL